MPELAQALPAALPLRRERVDWWTPSLITPALVVIAVFFVAPFGILVSYSLKAPEGSSGIGFEQFVRLFAEPLYRSIIATTIGLALVVTLATLIVGYALALAIVRSHPRYRRLLVNLVVLPLLLSGVIRTFGWMVLLAQSGPVNLTAKWLGLVDQPLRILGTYTGVAIGLTHVLLPFMILALTTNLAYISPSLDEAAQGLGANRFRAFFRVTLPLSLPGISTGTLLVFIMAMGGFVTASMLGYGRVKVLSILVLEQTTATVDWAFASATAMVLLALTLAFLGLNRYVLASTYVQHATGGGRR